MPAVGLKGELSNGHSPQAENWLSLNPRFYTPYMPAVGLKGELNNEQPPHDAKRWTRTSIIVFLFLSPFQDGKELGQMLGLQILYW